MKLPSLKYDVPAAQQEIVAFRGLNLSDQRQTGEFSACENLSDRRYPYLCPRNARSKEQYDDPTALFEWNGHMVVVDGGLLYYDGSVLDNVTPGEKQFTVVNTKLCIWPDRAYIDLTDGTFGRLDGEVTTPEDAVSSGSVTTSSLTIPISPKIGEDLTCVTFGGNASTSNPCVYTYGTDVEAVKACWDSEAGQWVGLEELETLSGLFNDKYGVDEWMHWNGGKIFIPEVSGNGFSFPHAWAGKELPDKAAYNQEGYYGIFTNVTDKNGDAAYVGTDGSSVQWHFDIYKVGVEGVLLSSVFQVGDVISVSGTPLGLCDVEKRQITDISDKDNTLHFAEGTFLAPLAYCVVAADATSNTAYCSRTVDGSKSYYKFVTDELLKAGDVLFFSNDGQSVQVWDAEAETVKGVYSFSSSSYNSNYPLYDMKDYALTGVIRVWRPMPELDFVCESDNRLWGVSNADKTIYASALGDPRNFYVYAGLSTDSYAVAVGSEGDFTGICKYGNSVLCWKERTLHKILGSYPAEFQMATYQYSGVRSGCHKSMININEVLYYLGTSGVYAYAGGTPDCISRAFGQHVFSQGVAGTDGQRYYLSAKDQDGSWSLLVYDTQNGLWLREDDTQAVDFCRLGDKLLFLSGDTVVTMDDGTEAVEWSATLAPFYETVQGRKCLSKLFLRVEVPKGSWMRVQVRCDGGRWAECGKIVGGGTDARVLPIAPNRCDKFEVRLSGKGECAVLSLLREFRVGSER